MKFGALARSVMSRCLPGWNDVSSAKQNSISKEGVELARSDKLDQALERFHRVCNEETTGESKCKAYYYTGRIFHKQGKLHKAEIAWRKCLHLNPGYKQAKEKLVELILLKPRKKWTPEERLWVEGSEFAKTKPLPKKAKSSSRWITWSVALGVIGIFFLIGYFISTLAIQYFTFDRHIEQNPAFGQYPTRLVDRFNILMTTFEGIPLIKETKLKKP